MPRAWALGFTRMTCSVLVLLHPKDLTATWNNVFGFSGQILFFACLRHVTRQVLCPDYMKGWSKFQVCVHPDGHR